MQKISLVKGLQLQVTGRQRVLTEKNSQHEECRWMTEARDKYTEKDDLRPKSKPIQEEKPLSLMDVQEPVFHHTKAYNDRKNLMPVNQS